jgi:hypothetical protein
MRTDGQTEMKVTVAFRDFAKAPKKLQMLPTECIYGFHLIRRINSDYFPYSVNKLILPMQTKCFP